MTKQFVYRTSIVLFSAILTACGGGGGGSGDTEFESLTGTFYDSKVAGLRYTSTSNTGITNANGEFHYRPGEELTFYIGNTVVGKATGRSVLTPVDVLQQMYDDTEIIIEGTASDPDANIPVDEDSEDPTHLSDAEKDYAIVNLVRLLTSIDEDGNPDNGIQISQEAHTAFQNNVTKTPNFSLTFDEFNTSETVNQIMQSTFNGAAAIRRLTTPEAARQHLAISLLAVKKSNDEDGDGIPDIIDQAPNNKDLFSDIDGDSVQDKDDLFPYYKAEFKDSDEDYKCTKEEIAADQLALENAQAEAVASGETVTFTPNCIAYYYTINLNIDRSCQVNASGLVDSGCMGPYRVCIDTTTNDQSICRFGEGFGDNTDKFPQDAGDWLDSDNDHYGDNAEIKYWQERDPSIQNPHQNATLGIDSDFDSYDDEDDAFPNNPNEWKDTDGDAMCSETELAADQEKLLAAITSLNTALTNYQQEFDDGTITEEELQEKKDSETATFTPTCPGTVTTEIAECQVNLAGLAKHPTTGLVDEECMGEYRICFDANGDGECLFGEGYGDNDDDLILDPTEWLDTDGDGVGNNSDPRPDNVDNDYDGIAHSSDLFPNDPNNFSDLDNDGVGDFSDPFPSDSAGSVDTDSDGLPDYFESLYSESTTALNPASDTDNDGFNALIEYQYSSDPTDRTSIPAPNATFVTTQNQGAQFLPINSSDITSFKKLYELSLALDTTTNTPALPGRAGSLKSGTSAATGRYIYNDGRNSLSRSSLDTTNDAHSLNWANTDRYNKDNQSVHTFAGWSINQTDFYSVFNDFSNNNPGFRKRSVITNNSFQEIAFSDANDLPIKSTQPESAITNMQSYGHRSVFIGQSTNQVTDINTSSRLYSEYTYDLYKDPSRSSEASQILAFNSNGKFDLILHGQDTGSDVPGEEYSKLYVETFHSVTREKFTGDTSETPYSPIEINLDSTEQAFTLSPASCSFSNIYANQVAVACQERGESSNANVSGFISVLDLGTQTLVWTNNLDTVSSSINNRETDPVRFISLLIAPFQTSENNSTQKDILFALTQNSLTTYDIKTVTNGEASDTNINHHIQTYTPTHASEEPGSTDVFESEFDKSLIVTNNHVFISESYYEQTHILTNPDLIPATFDDPTGFDLANLKGGQLIHTPEGNIVISKLLSEEVSGTYTNTLRLIGLNLNGDTDNDGMSDDDEEAFNGLDPLNPDDANEDADGDTVSNIQEILDGRDPTVAEDADGDGLPDYWEEANNFDPNSEDNSEASADNDGDGFTNLEEFINGTDPNTPEDEDNDGLPDYWERLYAPNGTADEDLTTVLSPGDDLDKDAFTNLQEYNNGTNPVYAEDFDNDGMPDGWEDKYDLDRTDPSDANQDRDLDGISNLDEYKGETNPLVQEDTDKDGMPDVWEIQYGFDPNTNGPLHDEEGNAIDTDGDGVSDYQEFQNGTIPNDSDNDGMPDNWEEAHGLIYTSDPDSGIDTNDANLDPDSDGLTNIEEYNEGWRSTDPNSADTDEDGMPDGWEVNHNLNPVDNSDAALDRNNDNQTNLEEYQASIAA